MALIDCRECGSKISTEAAACPKCGAPPVLPRATAVATVSPGTGAARSQRSSPLITTLFSVVVVAGLAWFALRLFVGERGADAALATVVRAPIVVEDEVASVPAMNVRGVPIQLPYSGELELEVNVVKGEHVNVYVIDVSDWSEFERAHAALFGGKFHHYPAFQGTESKQLRRTGRLSAGAYYIVIENPTMGILVASSFDVAVKATLRP